MTTTLVFTRRSCYTNAAQMVDGGQLKPVVDRFYPLAQAGEAQRALEAGETLGRVVLEI